MAIEMLKNIKVPTVQISRVDWEFVHQMCLASPGSEFAWFGKVERIEGGYFLSDIMVPEQKCHAATTETYADGLLQLITENPHIDTDKLRLWGHRHPGSVQPSGQDKDEMLENSVQCDFFIGWIHNNQGEDFIWITDTIRNLLYKDIPLEIVNTSLAIASDEDLNTLEIRPMAEYLEWIDELTPYAEEKTAALVELRKAVKSLSRDIERALTLQDTLRDVCAELDDIQQEVDVIKDAQIAERAKATIKEKVKSFGGYNSYPKTQYYGKRYDDWDYSYQRNAYDGYSRKGFGKNVPSTLTTEETWEDGDFFSIGQGYFNNVEWVKKWRESTQYSKSKGFK